MNKRVDIEQLPGYAEIDLTLILPDPMQPRRHFDSEEIAVLATSIKNVGFVHPVVVRQPDSLGRFRLVVGERRWRAAKRLGLKTIPAIIRHYSDQEAWLEAQLAENLPTYRADWSVRERAEALRRFISGFPTMEAAAERLGKSPGWLSQMVDLIELPPAIRSLNDRDIVRDRITLITLKRLASRNPAVANELIHKANTEHRLTRAEVLAQMAIENGVHRPAALGQGNAERFHAPETAAPALFVRSPEKFARVAQLLGLDADVSPDLLLDRLMDEYLRLNEGRPTPSGRRI